jgi:predicted secreted protein
LYAVIWFMTFLIVLPIRVKTQGDVGKIVPGTHAGAPEVHNLKAKALITTGVAVMLWVLIAGVIVSGWITVDDLDWFNLKDPAR